MSGSSSNNNNNNFNTNNNTNESHEPTTTTMDAVPVVPVVVTAAVTTLEFVTTPDRGGGGGGGGHSNNDDVTSQQQQQRSSPGTVPVPVPVPPNIPPPPPPPLSASVSSPSSTPTATRITSATMTLEQLQLASALLPSSSSSSSSVTPSITSTITTVPITTVAVTAVAATSTVTPASSLPSSSVSHQLQQPPPPPTPPQYSYPVATFVRDFVRTNLLSPQQQQQQQPLQLPMIPIRPTPIQPPPEALHNNMDDNDHDLLPLSIRSESDLLLSHEQQTQQQNRMMTSGLQQQRQVQSEFHLLPSSLTSVPTTAATSIIATAPQQLQLQQQQPDLMLSDEEYIVIDGDLIAIRSTPPYIPPSSPLSRRDHRTQQQRRRTTQQQQQSSTNNNNNNNNSNQLTSFNEQLFAANQQILSNHCQPKKVRRGIRKLTKLFQRGGGSNNNNDTTKLHKQQQQQHATTNVETKDGIIHHEVEDDEAELFGNQPIELSLLQVVAAAVPTTTSNSNDAANDEMILKTTTTASNSSSPKRRPSLQKVLSKTNNHSSTLKKPPPTSNANHSNNTVGSSKKLRWGRKKQPPPPPQSDTTVDVVNNNIREQQQNVTTTTSNNNNNNYTIMNPMGTIQTTTMESTYTTGTIPITTQPPSQQSTTTTSPRLDFDDVEHCNTATTNRNNMNHDTVNHYPPPRQRMQSIEMPVTMGLEPPSTENFDNDNDEERNFLYDQQIDTNNNGVVVPPPPLTPPRPFHNDATTIGNDRRQTSVTASYIGTADILSNSGNGTTMNALTGSQVQSTSVAAESFVEEDLYDAAFFNKKEDDMDLFTSISSSSSYVPLSLISDHVAVNGGDLKVDKADAPDVEAMLRRALIETTNDLEFFSDDSDNLRTNEPISMDYYATTTTNDMEGHARYEGGKSDEGHSIPLSSALPYHSDVQNDVLKVVLVSASSVDKSWIARRLRNYDRKARPRTTLAVDVHEWIPPGPHNTDEYQESKDDEEKEHRVRIKCVIWDVQGASATIGSSAESRSNFGTHPGTQSLFFSPQSLYLLCWDLGCNNPKTNRLEQSKDDDSDYDDDEDDEDYEDDFIREEANRQADRALHADIIHRVLSWYDCIARIGPRSAVLPVALVPEGMSVLEVKRRCEMMRIVLEDHFHRNYELDKRAPILLTGTESTILCVNNYGDAQGIKQLQEMVGAIANDESNSVFDHLGTSVPVGTVLVREAIQRFKEEHKLILLDHLLGDLGTSLEVTEVITALQFLASIGEILYFGTDDEDVLSRYIILSRKWLISALSCILRNDLKRELTETRRFMNMQCIYSDQRYEENAITTALISGKSSSCPLLSDEDAKMLWQSMSFMREASDRYSNLTDRSTTIPTMFYFLERLLVHSGVFLPLRVSQQNASFDQSEVFFVPSLLSQGDPTNMWTYMTSESWMTTLCHSWLFRDGAPPNLIEHIAVQILRDLYGFSLSHSETPNREVAHRVHSAPVTRKSFDAVEQQPDTIGRVHIHHVVCFKSSMLIKIGTIFADDKSGNLRESFVEIFVAVVDQTSPHTVASDVMRPCMQRVIVSGKGQVGRHGHKLWKGGYKVVFESVQNTVANLPNVDAQVICPECLATCSPRISSTWGWDVVSAAAKSGNPHVICLRGHRVNSNLICGTIPEKKSAPYIDHQSSQRVTKSLNIKDTLPSVVLVGVWDPTGKCILSIGSGCIVDKKAGLVVTAGHVMFNMDNSSGLFGVPYFGCRGARAVIAIIPNRESKHAVFRYFAEIVACDVRNVDACILQIRSRMEKDVDVKDGVGAIDQPETLLVPGQLSGEDLRPLKLTKNFDIAESVRLLGYSQEGEGLYAIGKHVSPSVEFVEGRIHRLFKATRTQDDGFDSDSSSTTTASNNSHQQQPNIFVPREEIILHCLVNSGHSGGPCVNSEGKVVGILSRSDPGQRDRCYLVPASELRPLIMKAKATCLPRPSRITTMQTM